MNEHRDRMLKIVLALVDEIAKYDPREVGSQYQLARIQSDAEALVIEASKDEK